MNIDFSYDLDYDRKEHTGRIIKTILKILFWLIILAGAVVAGWAVTKFCVEKTKMVGNSMEGVLSNGDSVLINLLHSIESDISAIVLISFQHVEFLICQSIQTTFCYLIKYK